MVGKDDHDSQCRREVRSTPDKAYMELRWVCVKECQYFAAV
jgi:hypothetical protein